MNSSCTGNPGGGRSKQLGVKNVGSDCGYFKCLPIRFSWMLLPHFLILFSPSFSPLNPGFAVVFLFLSAKLDECRDSEPNKYLTSEYGVLST